MGLLDKAKKKEARKIRIELQKKKTRLARAIHNCERKLKILREQASRLEKKKSLPPDRIPNFGHQIPSEQKVVQFLRLVRKMSELDYSFILPYFRELESLSPLPTNAIISIMKASGIDEEKCQCRVTQRLCLDIIEKRIPEGNPLREKMLEEANRQLEEEKETATEPTTENSSLDSGISSTQDEEQPKTVKCYNPFASSLTSFPSIFGTNFSAFGAPGPFMAPIFGSSIICTPPTPIFSTPSISGTPSIFRSSSMSGTSSTPMPTPISDTSSIFRSSSISGTSSTPMPPPISGSSSIFCSSSISGTSSTPISGTSPPPISCISSIPCTSSIPISGTSPPPISGISSISCTSPIPISGTSPPPISGISSISCTSSIPISGTSPPPISGTSPPPISGISSISCTSSTPISGTSPPPISDTSPPLIFGCSSPIFGISGRRPLKRDLFPEPETNAAEQSQKRNRKDSGDKDKLKGNEDDKEKEGHDSKRSLLHTSNDHQEVNLGARQTEYEKLTQGLENMVKKKEKGFLHELLHSPIATKRLLTKKLLAELRQDLDLKLKAQQEAIRLTQTKLDILDRVDDRFPLELIERIEDIAIRCSNDAKAPTPPLIHLDDDEEESANQVVTLSPREELRLIDQKLANFAKGDRKKWELRRIEKEAMQRRKKELNCMIRHQQ